MWSGGGGEGGSRPSRFGGSDQPPLRRPERLKPDCWDSDARFRSLSLPLSSQDLRGAPGQNSCPHLGPSGSLGSVFLWTKAPPKAGSVSARGVGVCAHV